MQVPFYREYHFETEINRLKQVIDSGATGGEGPFMIANEDLLQTDYGYDKALMTSSGSHALEMAAQLLDIGEGDEVLLPSFNFPSAANSIVMMGATPVFVDVLPETMNLCSVDMASKKTDKTRAIFLTHYAGVACEMDKILAFAREHDLKVVEDAAQSMDAYYVDADHGERPLGSMGDLGCLSFHSSKNFIAGEGGALLLNGVSKDLQERAEIIRQKGTNRSSFLRGEREKYTWVDRGSSYCPSELAMAMLHEQLLHKEDVRHKREVLTKTYFDQLQSLADKGLLQLMTVPEYSKFNHHIFYILLAEELDRSQVQAKMMERGVETRFHFVPLHSSLMGKKLLEKNRRGKKTDGKKQPDKNQPEMSLLPRTENLSKRLLRLPLHTGMTIAEADYTAEQLTKVLESLS